MLSDGPPGVLLSRGSRSAGWPSALMLREFRPLRTTCCREGASSTQEIVEAEEGPARRTGAGADERREGVEEPGAALRVGDDHIALAAEQRGDQAVEAGLGQRVALIAKGFRG